MVGKLSLFTPHSSTIMSMNQGIVYPALVREMYPNDRIVISHEALLRAAPMLFPLYSPVKMTFDYFFNENRNVWKGDEASDWSAFITGSINGNAIENLDDLPEHPWITVPEGGFAVGSLGDYLGFNTEPELAGAKVSALRFRHYNKIMSDYYLDENLSTMPNIGYGAGEDTITDLNLINRCWNKDRFTTAALQPQKTLSVGVPLAGQIPIVGDGNALRVYSSPDINNDTGTYRSGSLRLVKWGSDDALSLVGAANNTNGNGEFFKFSPVVGQTGLTGLLDEATQIPIDELHFLTQVERLNQRDNMWGTRDFECIRTHFGVTIPDTRLQRATWLGRSVVDVHFSEVLQTSESTSTSAQGNITGHTLAVSKNKPIRYKCFEHGFLFVMVNIQPIAQYQQGIPRDALYQTRYDYMWPILSETGEQELFTAELKATAQNVTSRKIFGFEPRYNHLRFGEKTVHGDFRTNLSGYHAGRIFTEEPNLNEDFVKAVPTKRMFAVELQDVDAFWLRCEFDIKHVRRLPKWPTPSAIGKLF